MVNHTQKIRQLLPTNCLSAFNYFAGLGLNGSRGTRDTTRIAEGYLEIAL